MIFVFITLNVAAAVLTIVRMFVWSRYHPADLSPNNYTVYVVLTLIYMILDSWALIFFWFLFFVTGYWFIVFKLQS